MSLILKYFPQSWQWYGRSAEGWLLGLGGGLLTGVFKGDVSEAVSEVLRVVVRGMVLGFAPPQHAVRHSPVCC